MVVLGEHGFRVCRGWPVFSAETAFCDVVRWVGVFRRPDGPPRVNPARRAGGELAQGGQTLAS